MCRVVKQRDARGWRVRFKGRVSACRDAQHCRHKMHKDVHHTAAECNMFDSPIRVPRPWMYVCGGRKIGK